MALGLYMANCWIHHDSRFSRLNPHLLRRIEMNAFVTLKDPGQWHNCMVFLDALVVFDGLDSVGARSVAC
jgi:hypothetical protein